MNKRTWGILAGVVGTAVSAWWWREQLRSRLSGSQADLTPARERGTVIFDNTPTAADTSL